MVVRGDDSAKNIACWALATEVGMGSINILAISCVIRLQMLKSSFEVILIIITCDTTTSRFIIQYIAFIQWQIASSIFKKARKVIIFIVIFLPSFVCKLFFTKSLVFYTSWVITPREIIRDKSAFALGFARLAMADKQ
jgi:hypothetical protein